MYTLFFDLFGHLTGTSHHDPLIVFGRAARALPCLYILADKFPIIFVWNRIKFHVFIANHHRDWLFQNKAAPYRGVWTHPAALTTDSLLCIDVYL